MQLPSSPQSGANGSNMRSPAQSPHAQRPSQPDMFLKMLEGPVVSVTVGSGCHTAGYNLPVALFCHHSYLFRQTNLRYETATAQIYHNKKRKVFADGEVEAIEVKREGGEGDTKAEVLGDMTPGRIGTALIRLPDVDPAIFGLFLKYVYTGYYPAVVDAQSETARSTSHALVSTQHNAPYTPAKAAMPPPANINFRQVPPGGHIPPLPTPDMSTVTLSLNNDCGHPPIPPSVHAYLLAIRLGAPGFLNQALNHIYYGIGKYFTLTPKLVHYIWSNTSPHPFCTASPLRKLVLDVLVVHWSSTTTHIIAKYPTLWNEVFDTHRDLRHEFTTGLQAGTKVPPVQSYFVDTRMPSITGKADDKDSEVEIVEDRPLEVDTSAAVAAAVAAAAAAMEQNNVGGEEKK